MGRWIIGTVLALWLGLGALTVIGAVLFTQRLSSARVGIAGKLDSPAGEPVTIRVALPAGYGLTAGERADGAPPLNGDQEAQAVLADSFRVVLPHVTTYCTTYPVWRNEPPPPPAWFTLRFSDTPHEEYVVFRSGKRALYFVIDPTTGQEIPHEEARWKLSVGEFEAIDPAGTRARTWLLHIALAVQSRANPEWSTPETA